VPVLRPERFDLLANDRDIEFRLTNRHFRDTGATLALSDNEALTRQPLQGAIDCCTRAPIFIGQNGLAGYQFAKRPFPLLNSLENGLSYRLMGN